LNEPGFFQKYGKLVVKKSKLKNLGSRGRTIVRIFRVFRIYVDQKWKYLNLILKEINTLHTTGNLKYPYCTHFH